MSSTKKKPDEVDIESEEEEEEDDEEQNDEQPTEDDEKKEITDIRNPDVLTKYKLAAEIANKALDTVTKAAVPGARVAVLCEMGDRFILDAVSKIYKDKKVTKGVGFPTCVSINNIVGSFSPLKDDPATLADGDVVKIDLGVHVDGYLAQVAHTVVLSNPPITGRKADVLAAVHTAAEATIRLMKPGVSNGAITDVIDKVAKQFKVSTVQGVYSHQVKRFEIDAEKVIANNIPDVPLTGDQKTKDCKLEVNEVWALDIVMSTGTGKPVQASDRTTVFKRAPEEQYKLKMKASRAVLAEISTKFPTFPFSMRALEFDEKKAKFGIVECYKHGLVESYPVLTEKEGDFVAHVKFTALLLPNGTSRITGFPFNMANIKSDHSVVDEELKAILAQSISKKKKSAAKKKKNKKKASVAAAGAAGGPSLSAPVSKPSV